jgi:hypothetical protein
MQYTAWNLAGLTFEQESSSMHCLGMRLCASSAIRMHCNSSKLACQGDGCLPNLILAACETAAPVPRGVRLQQVLCASNDAHDLVDPIDPPAGVPNGERVTFEGFPGPPLDEVNPKKKITERLFPDMVTDASGTPSYKGARFMTSQGPITSTIPNAHVA